MTRTYHLLYLLLPLLLIACATPTKDNPDPYEGYNRKMYTFNAAVDHLYLRPMATIYSKSPDPLQAGVSNFSSNIKTLNSAANQLLQLNAKGLINDLGRFAINSTVGIAGLFDPATTMGLAANRQDFGQTLARWGYHESAYFVIPLLGPATVRDTIGRGVDMVYLSPSRRLIHNRTWRRRYSVLNAVNGRARALPFEKAIRQAFDPYILVRNAYLQRRHALIARTLGKTPNKITKPKPAKTMAKPTPKTDN